jgi:hypothetical protein
LFSINPPFFVMPIGRSVRKDDGGRRKEEGGMSKEEGGSRKFW